MKSRVAFVKMNILLIVVNASRVSEKCNYRNIFLIDDIFAIKSDLSYFTLL